MILPYLVIAGFSSVVLFYIILAISGPAANEPPKWLMAWWFLSIGCGIAAVIYSFYLVIWGI